MQQRLFLNTLVILMSIKTRNSGEWSEARFHSFVKSALRSASQRWPPKYKVLSKAYVGQRINPKSGRMAKHYLCKACEEAFPAKEIQVNHIVPVVPVTGFDTWDGVVERMFCEESGLEVLCKNCHSTITDKENKIRRAEKVSRLG